MSDCLAYKATEETPAHTLSLVLTCNNRLTMITESGEKIDQSRLQMMIEDWLYQNELAIVPLPRVVKGRKG